METEVTDVIEETVNTISGIDELRSFSTEGLSLVFIQFELEEEADVKAQDVRDKVALARRLLPEGAEPPVVEKMDPDSSPILAVMIAGPMEVRELTRFADEVVKQRLERVPGVGSATLVGGREREIRIWLDAYRLRGNQLTADDVIRAVHAEHAEMPGGRMEMAAGRSELIFKTLGEMETADAFGDIVVAHRQGGPIRLRDLGRVEDGLEDERSYAELDGKPGVSLVIQRQSGRNTVEVARAVRREVEHLAELAPPGVEMKIARDISRFIESSIRDVTEDMLLGGLLAALVTFLFLRSLRTTVIVAVAIPTSIVSALFFFYLFDFTINMLSLLALSISIGILIDDAIVVLENVYRHVEAGTDRRTAAIEASREIAPAVVAATLAIGAVFVPIAFMQGVVGRFFKEYGLSVVFAVFMSLLVALTLTPVLCSRLLRAGVQHGAAFRFLESGFERLERAYRRLLTLALRHRGPVIALAVAATLGGVWIGRQIPLAFTSSSDRSEFQAFVELPAGTGIQETKRVVHQSSLALGELEGVDFVFATIGNRANEAGFYLRLQPKGQRELSQFDLMEGARAALREISPDAKSISATEVPWVGGGSQDYNLQYAILGPDLEKLDSISRDIASRMEGNGTFVDVTNSFDTGQPEVQARVDRGRAAAMGINVRTLAATLRYLVGGARITTFQEAGERYDVRVRLEEDQRDEISKLGLIQVRGRDGRLVDLGNLATLSVGSGPAAIERQDRTRRVEIVANTPPGVSLGTATAELERLVRDIELPAGYTASIQGDAEMMNESFEAILFAFTLALVSLYMILASEFNSFVQPIIVMLTAPLSFIGAFAALWVMGQELSLFAQIGMVILMGLVMKNGILLVDYVNQLRRQGESYREAVLQASAVRLRPILMTTVSTVAGMIPVALSTSDGAEFRNPMGILVIGGLLSSMFLTLFVVPVFYCLIAAVGERLGGSRAPVASHPEVAPSDAAPLRQSA
jgi:HAE1 family hydrophobic/amphiphilic exporter-1